MSAFSGWEAAVLQSIGAPITAANVAFLDAWQEAEGGTAAFNPLNTTQPASGATPYNENGGNPVWNYGSASQGVAATAQTLTNGYYPNIVAALQSGNPFNTSNLAGLQQELKTWGTGAGWLSGAMPATGNASVGASTPAGGSWWDNVKTVAGAGGEALGNTIAPGLGTSVAVTGATAGNAGPFQGLANTITSAAQNAGLLAIALAFVAGGFAWLAAPTIKEYAPQVAKAAAA